MVKSVKDIDVSVTPTSTPNIIMSDKDAAKKKLEECIAKDTRLVEGTFIYEEYKGSHFHFKLKKYKDVPMFDMDMWDGCVYKIPKWVADWINGRDESKDALNPNADKMTHSCQVAKNAFQVSQNEFPKFNLDGQTQIPMVNKTYTIKMRFIPLTFGE